VQPNYSPVSPVCRVSVDRLSVDEFPSPDTYLGLGMPQLSERWSKSMDSEEEGRQHNQKPAQPTGGKKKTKRKEAEEARLMEEKQQLEKQGAVKERLWAQKLQLLTQEV
jgi:hypothetical protein